MELTSDRGIPDEALADAVKQSLAGRRVAKALLLPPDCTRLFSGGGKLAVLYYRLLSPTAEVDVMPAVGTHFPMTRAECEAFFEGAIPFDRIIHHSWRTDVVKLGEVSAEFVSRVSEGLVNEKIDVELNRRIVDPSYDVVVSIGQVVPHEVVGMANYSKNVFVGCGGHSMINSSHILGAFWGAERLMGKDFSPVRKVFDYAEERFLSKAPLLYALTVASVRGGELAIHGFYAGRERALFEKAVALSQKKNITHLDRPIKKAVVYLDPREFRSAWLGNKSIYRTRMALAPGAELFILAPGVRQFGEDAENDALIRKYGYVGRLRILELVKTQSDLRANLSVAAHLIHGSSDGKFSVTYCTELLSEEEVRGVGFDYMPYEKARALFKIEALTEGWNRLADEEIYYIGNPALGLWSLE
ncbi:MAG: lactate racemase domain-containing protein [Spirochaetaceae bacterium]|jgi:nickel-dependent lactate racemase|nr:lactate racemase domain-containing protein [Spirochaetaceae bacterium]